MNIKPIQNHGVARWMVDFGLAAKGRRHREFFATEEEAGDALKQAQKDRARVGRQWASIPPERRARVIEVLDEIAREGWTLESVWQTFKIEKLRPLENAKRRNCDQAIAEVLSAKIAANRRPRYIASLETYLRLFAKGRECQMVDRISAADIQQWFATRKEAPSTKASNLGRLSALFGYCHRHGYVNENPCDRVERVSIDAKPPVILSVVAARRMVRLCARKRPNFLAGLVLGLFAGIRPEEIQELRWPHIDLKRRQARLDKTKLRNWRIVDLPANAVAWLRLVARKKGPVSPKISALRRSRRFLRERLKLRWSQDLLRHTAASYAVAAGEDIPKVAFQLGNSPKILLKHYRNLVSREEAAKFFDIRPAK